MAKVDAVLKADIANINGLIIPSAAVGTPAAAYSVRLLDSSVGVPTYTGACMRVRRDSDNVEADVGFDSNDELSLTSPISNTSDAQSYTDFADFVDHTGIPANGYVRKWYDQSSNTNDAEQSVSTIQPQIYNGSAVITQGTNNNAAVYFDSDALETISAIYTGDATLDWFLVENSQDNVTSSGKAAMGIVADTYASDRRNLSHLSNETTTQAAVRFFGGNTTYSNTNQGYRLSNINYQGGGGAFDARINGVALTQTGSSNIGLNLQSAQSHYIGASAQANINLNPGEHYVSEVIMYTTDQSTNRSGIEINMNGFFQIY